AGPGSPARGAPGHGPLHRAPGPVPDATVIPHRQPDPPIGARGGTSRRAPAPPGGAVSLSDPAHRRPAGAPGGAQGPPRPDAAQQPDPGRRAGLPPGDDPAQDSLPLDAILQVRGPTG